MDYEANILNYDSYVRGGTVYRGTDAVGKMCRELGEGILRVYSTTGIAFVVPDIAARARLSLTEGDKGLKYVKYRPNPFAKTV
jgi:hypothetical protein